LADRLGKEPRAIIASRQTSAALKDISEILGWSCKSWESRPGRPRRMDLLVFIWEAIGVSTRKWSRRKSRSN